MTLIEAIKTGKHMRRPGGKAWKHPNCLYDSKDILAEDWEVREGPTTIWMNVYAEGDDSVELYSTHPTKELAERNAPPNAKRVAVPFKESAE